MPMNIRACSFRSMLASAALAVLFSALSAPAFAQWLKYPTAGIPRTPDGKPNLSAPAPKTADGKPDLSGLWEMERKELGGEPGNTIGLGDEPVNREFVNIGSRLQGGLAIPTM